MMITIRGKVDQSCGRYCGLFGWKGWCWSWSVDPDLDPDLDSFKSKWPLGYSMIPRRCELLQLHTSSIQISEASLSTNSHVSILVSFTIYSFRKQKGCDQGCDFESKPLKRSGTVVTNMVSTRVAIRVAIRIATLNRNQVSNRNHSNLFRVSISKMWSQP